MASSNNVNTFITKPNTSKRRKSISFSLFFHLYQNFLCPATVASTDMYLHVLAVLLQFFPILNRQVKFCQSNYRYIIWYTCLAEDLVKRPIWIPALVQRHLCVCYSEFTSVRKQSFRCIKIPASVSPNLPLGLFGSSSRQLSKYDQVLFSHNFPF